MSQVSPRQRMSLKFHEMKQVVLLLVSVPCWGHLHGRSQLLNLIGALFVFTGGGAERLFPDTCRNVLNETSLLSSRRSSQPLSALYMFWPQLLVRRTNVRMRKCSCAHAQEFLINMAARCPQGLVHHSQMKLVGALLSSVF